MSAKHVMGSGFNIADELPEFRREGWSNDESLLLACVMAGVPGDFSKRRVEGCCQTSIRSLVIVQLLIECAEKGRYPETGVVCRGASIIGPLDLREVELMNDAPLPPLTLANCCLDDMIDARGVNLSALTLTECRMAGLDARGARTADPIIVTGARPLEGKASCQFHIDIEAESVSFALLGQSGLDGFSRQPVLSR